MLARGICMANYYDLPALSASGINKWYVSPYHYWLESPYNENRKTKEPTPAMILGTLAHCLLFEPAEFINRFAIEPEGTNKRTKEGKFEWEAFRNATIGLTAISQEQYDKAQEMRNAIFTNKGTKRLLGNGSPEHELFWVENGLNCKAKIDCLREIESAYLVIDYKTGSHVKWNSLETYIYNMGYHRQAAWYLNGVEKTLGKRPDGFAFIIQGVDYPELIAMPVVSEQMIELGDYENKKAASDIKRRLETGDWMPYPEHMFTIDVPVWAYKKMQNEINGEVIC